MSIASWRPIAAAVAAAALFGAGVPVAKVFSGHVDPVVMAALLYLGSGAGLFVLQGISALLGRRSRKASIARADLPWLAGATLAGGGVWSRLPRQLKVSLPTPNM